VQSFKNLQEYDIVELRAIYACLPKVFGLDSTPGRQGEKAEWKNGLVARLKGYVSQQNAETVNSGWDPLNNCEKFEKLKPLSSDLERNAAYVASDRLGAKRQSYDHFSVSVTQTQK